MPYQTLATPTMAFSKSLSDWMPSVAYNMAYIEIRIVDYGLVAATRLPDLHLDPLVG
jgi:hypothetical protein